MALVVQHAFQSGLADVPGDVTAGKVTPSRWNADHAVTGNVTQRWTAGETISALKVLRGDGASAFVIDIADIADMHLCIGIAETSGSTGNPVEVLQNGVLNDAGWSWTPGPVYAGAGGSLVQTAPAAAFLLRVGTAVSPTRMLVQIERPIRL